jgi:predicted CXXCH cytochrome family protein
MLRNLGCGVFNALLPPALLVLLLAIRLTSAQEITTTPDGRRVAVTIFDEIDDVRERRAFREVWETSDPRAQRDLAARFVERYPRSILLREAYELAARASVAAGDLAAGLDWARRSLRLLPENPSLLVLVADAATRLRQFDLGETSARDALRALEHADRPSSMNSKQWTEIRSGLLVGALVILGRAAATNGRYADAETALVAALALAPGDSEASKLLAAVRNLSAIARSAKVDAGGATEGTTSTRAREIESEDRSSETKAERYAGSTACRDCHPRVYERWQATGMAKMFRAYRAENVIGDFSGQQTVSGSARAIMVGDKHFVEIRKGDSQDWIRYPVDYTIGSKWQQAYATKLPDNRLAVLPIQYSRLQSTWLNYWKIVDAPGSARTDIARFHEIPEQAVYQQTCAPCHTSQLRFQTSARAPEDATFREGGVNCEMCHGPSLNHVERMKAGVGPSTSLRTGPANASTPIKFKSLSPAESVAICAQCHAQSAVHDAERSGAVNYSTDRTWYRTYPMHLMSSFPRDAFYRDGRFKATTFISEAFTRSQCFRKGGATCASCHDPHPPDAAQNPTSLKFSEASNQMCLQCHTDLRKTGPRGALAQHTRHAEGSEASRCVSCHMPRITEALLFKARSHQIDDIPDVAMTERFGNDESPNACLSCHQDRDAAWLRRVSAQRALDPGGDPWRR